MEASHFHVGVRDMDQAILAFANLWDMTPRYKSETMAAFSFGSVGLLIDKTEEDIAVTLAFDSSDCRSDFERLVAKGARVLQPPEEKPWGVCAAYLVGPGKITVEIEQVLKG